MDTQLAFYSFRELGGIVNLTSASRTLQWTYGHEPYGTARNRRKPHHAGTTASQSATSADTFDPTGLSHLRALQSKSASVRPGRR
jgi:hypothetical protein